MDPNEPTFDELLDAFQSSGSPSPFRPTYGVLTSRGVAYMAALVNDGVWSVDELLQAFDEGLATGATPPGGEQVLRDVARERGFDQIWVPPLDGRRGYVSSRPRTAAEGLLQFPLYIGSARAARGRDLMKPREKLVVEKCHTFRPQRSRWPA